MQSTFTNRMKYAKPGTDKPVIAPVTPNADGTLLAEITTFEQREILNSVYRYIKQHGLFTDAYIAGLRAADRDAYIALCNRAHLYARLYRGTDGMMRDFCDKVTQGVVLSDRMVRATLNALYTEGQRLVNRARPTCSTPAPAPAQPEPAALAHIANGYYTVQMPDNTHVTLRLDDDFRSTAPQGSQCAAYLYGSDNTSEYSGFAFVTGGRITVWGKQRGKVGRQETALRCLLSGGLDAARQAGHMYAISSSKCCRCNRLLTVEASVNRGLGPECAKKAWNC